MEIFFSHHWVTILSAIVLSFIIAYISIPSIINVAREKGLYDVPNSRTSHKHKTPTLGGIAIFSGFIIAALAFSNALYMPESQYIVLGVIIMFLLGLKDDILIIAPFKKLIGQITAGVIITDLAGLRITDLHGFLGIHLLDYHLSLYLTIFIIIVITNAFNLIDGIDGLSSGLGIVSLLGLGIWFYFNLFHPWAIYCFSMIGALAAFYRYNVFSSDKKIFMGDTGSMMLGFLVAIMIIKFNELNLIDNLPFYVRSSPAVSIALLVIPLFDTLRVFTIRIAKGSSPFKPDKRHLHHILLDLGLKHSQASSILIAYNLFMIIIAFALSNTLGILSLSFVIFFISLVFTYIPWLIRKKRVVKMQIENLKKENNL